MPAAERAVKFLRLSLREIAPRKPNMVHFNDRASHPDVLALFDRAIAKLEAESK
jgi:hypothetical protein